MIYAFGETVSSPSCSPTAREAREAGLLARKTPSGFCRLADLPPGSGALIVRIEGNQQFKRNMTNKGLLPGDCIERVPSAGKSFVSVSGGCHICCDLLETELSREETLKILVCPLKKVRSPAFLRKQHPSILPLFLKNFLKISSWKTNKRISPL